MSRNKYQSVVESISVPAGLEEKVLGAARRQEAGAGPERPVKRWARPALRAAACALCALALVVGNVRLRTPAPPAAPGETGGETVRQAEGLQPPLSFSFGLTAYAAGGEYSAREDGAIAFAMGDGMANPGEGDFTGCLFRVTGEEIASVALSLDRGGLYRYRILENLTEEEMACYRQNMGTRELATAAISQTEDGVWYMPEMSALGNEVQEAYDPEVRYGFWVPPEEMVYNTGLGITTEAKMEADFFDGAKLKVTAVFKDGSERTRTYRLRTGSLKVEWTEDYVLTVLPELAGEEDPCVYGIYATPED